MARPKKITDGQLLASCGQAIGRYGPGFTLAQVAVAAGVATGTVAGRFGSKHGLLVALMDSGTAVLAQRMQDVVRAHDDPVAALRAAVLVMGEGVGDPATARNHLAQLGTDLADPVLQQRFALQRALVRNVLCELVEAAALPLAPPAPQAAAILAALANGLVQDWALLMDGQLEERLRSDLDAVLRSWQGGPGADPEPREHGREMAHHDVAAE
ncbi:TetR family transcriptional regulator [Streptomyces yerevanensis]|uniref:TetR family transcriptional regulator n=1 Tax=Streptomyces yerevanensis TaxID=66378 RepID=UPI0006894CC9|nr:TetR family transcriptional regulator [Streptomyces yerevanensis]